mmetsp:Transcript_17933/g.15838  ORF Transcript_17933/g.15838 Transcript_17933/m.15838 type:complete len:128 (+) Transcript_17933:73-456(+)
MTNNCMGLHDVCFALEKCTYYHKIDKDNLNSQADVQFIKKAQKIERKDDEEQEDYGIYLFGLKVEYKTLVALINNFNILQSIISRHRCTFCFKQCSKKKYVRKEASKKPERDLLPICKNCVEKELYK